MDAQIINYLDILYYYKHFKAIVFPQGVNLAKSHESYLYYFHYHSVLSLYAISFVISSLIYIFCRNAFKFPNVKGFIKFTFDFLSNNFIVVRG